MSDEEEYSGSEEEVEEVEEVAETKPAAKPEGEGDPEFIKRQDQKRSDLDDQLKEYINEWRKQRAKEEEELKRLKEKQAKRKVSRAEEEKRMAQRKKEEEERRQREVEEKKQRDIEEKRQRLEEAEKKRQAMLAAMKDASKTSGPNFTINKKSDNFGITGAQLERNKTKEQLEEEKKISLSIRIKPLTIENLSMDKLRVKAQELWDCIVKLETEKYDLEERQKRQDYDLKELKERQKQQLRHKALKKGLDPEALTGKHPPKIQVASKYERRVDTRSYDDKKKLFEGGLDTQTAELMDQMWQDRMEHFMKRKRRPRKTQQRLPGKGLARKDQPIRWKTKGETAEMVRRAAGQEDGRARVARGRGGRKGRRRRGRRARIRARAGGGGGRGGGGRRGGRGGRRRRGGRGGGIKCSRNERTRSARSPTVSVTHSTALLPTLPYNKAITLIYINYFLFTLKMITSKHHYFVT